MPILNIICPICTEVFHNPDNVHSTSCGHLFHLNCLNIWIERERNCPQCRFNNPTTHKVFLSFEDVENVAEELELKLKTSNDRITEILVQKNEAEANFMRMQEQFTESENSNKELEQRILEMNDYENNFMQLQAQYTKILAELNEREDQVKQLLLVMDTKSKELGLKTVENELLKSDVDEDRSGLHLFSLKEKIRTLQYKLDHVSEEFYKEIDKNAKLSLENMRLKSQTKQLASVDQSENRKNAALKPNDERNSSRIQNSKIDKNKNGANTNNSVYITGLPVDQITSPIENIIVSLAKKMGIIIFPDDLVKVSLEGNTKNTTDKVNVFVQFLSTELRSKFLANKNILENDSQYKCINIEEYMTVRILLAYAKEKLHNKVFNHFFVKSNKVFAKKYKSHPRVVFIRDKDHVDKLFNDNKQRCVTNVDLMKYHEFNLDNSL